MDQCHMIVLELHEISGQAQSGSTEPLPRLEEKIDTHSQKRDQFKDSLHSLELKVNRIQNRKERIEEKLENDYNFNPETDNFPENLASRSYPWPYPQLNKPESDHTASPLHSLPEKAGVRYR